MSGLDALFAPRAVAVLGVSRNPAKLGFRLLQNVLDGGYQGRVHAVNPSGEAILDVPSVPRIDALPEGVDLALVSLPAPAVTEALAALVGRRVRAAVVLSSGFGEVDEAGRRTQSAMLEAAREGGMRIVGPNCMGVFSAPARLNGTYFWDLPKVDGGIAVVSQSGAYGGLIFRQLGSRGLGVARFVSIGNQADVDIADVLEYLADDPATTLVACFVEALRDGRRFVEVARRTTARKPVIVLKGGRSDAGRRAAGSHTGSLAGTYDVYRAAFERAGIVLADETEEFFDAIEALTVVGGRRPTAPRVAVITVSGGPSVIAADTAERIGVAVPALADDARARLRRLLPSFAAVGNPVDLTPQVEPDRVAEAVRVVFDSPEIAGVVAVNVGLDIPAFADGIAEAAAASGKPTAAFTADAPRIAAAFAARGIPVLPSPERAVRAWRALWSARPRAAPPTPGSVTVSADLRTAVERVHGPLPYVLARRLLESVGVRFCREVTATTVDETVVAAGWLGYPVVVKADAAGLVHKTEAGGVRADLTTPAAVREACEEMRGRLAVERFVVQEQVGPGVEILIGARRDATFGPVVAAGAGGLLTEVMRDVSLRLAPVSEDEAREMLTEGGRARLLAGPRGLSRDDDGALVRALVGLGDLMLAVPAIVEIDLNPMIVSRGSAAAVDAVVIVEGSLG